MPDLINVIKNLLRDVAQFSHHASNLKLRSYQVCVANTIVDSIIHKRGLSIVVVFPRQSGKNELQAQIETYLLTLFSQLDAEMVKVSPTWKPQSLNAMRRLERVLSRNLITRDRWKKEQGYAYRIGSARIFFLAGSPHANVVGATANLLLQCDEAQDVMISKWDKDFAPMAASTNATRVFWGTAWTSQTLLARELRAARHQEKQDGLTRAFTITANDVAREVPAYGQFVQEQIARLGRTHPLVRTQFFCEEIDSQGGMFPPERRALMAGDHYRQLQPTAGKIYSILIDVAGVDESQRDLDGRNGTDAPSGRLQVRDATALTIVEVDLATLKDELIRAPTYRVMDRRLWVGVQHTRLYGEIRALAELWAPRFLVVDATGVGAGLASFLDKAFPGRVLPFLFTQKSKSDLGWGFLAVCDTGRFKDHADPDPVWSTFWQQIAHTQYEALPNKTLKWSVPDGTRDPAAGELIHDDLVISAALAAELDKQEWSVGGPTLIIKGRDPLQDIDKERF